jgi:hypothetical protein
LALAQKETEEFLEYCLQYKQKTVQTGHKRDWFKDTLSAAGVI